jgi:signal transduction histidine kinase
VSRLGRDGLLIGRPHETASPADNAGVTSFGVVAVTESVPSARSRWVGAGLAALVACVSVLGAWLALGPGGRSLHALVDDHTLVNAVDGVEMGGIAALLIWLRPRNRVGWLLLLCAATEAVAILGEGWALASDALSLPARAPLAWVGSFVWVPSLVLTATALPAIYPTGRATTCGARRIVRGGWASALCAMVGTAGLDATYRSSAPGPDLGDNPLTHDHGQAVFLAILVAGAVSALCLMAATVVWTLRRLRRSSSPEREQLAWLVACVVPSLVAAVAAPPVVAFTLSMLVNIGLPIGIVRHQLFDIKVILRRGLLYGLLLALGAAAYVAVVSVIGLITPSTSAPPFFAAASAALIVVPAHRWASGAVTRLVYGDRDDPVRALDRVGRHLGSRDATDLDAVAHAVADALRSPQVEIRDSAGTEVGRSGDVDDVPMHEATLHHGGRVVGTLRVAWRTRADRFSRADRRLIDTLAAPVAVALSAAVLARELAGSHARIVAVRDTERRALRNDLHDGLGPALSGVALGIEAALKAPDSASVKEILGVVHDEARTLVSEVRAIIEDLGPDAGLRGGLVSALRSHASAVATLTGLEVTVVARDELPALDAAVEAALHRIAAEALTNVVRHAGARHVTVRLDVDADTVRLVVADDGRGLLDAPEGVGRASMRGRACSVGGRLDIASRDGRGTVVTAEVPWRSS